MYRLFISELAHRDLDNIISYIVVQLANQAAAAKFLDELEKYYDNVQSNPFMYEQCHDAYLAKKGYRKAIIKNYVMIYKVDEEDKAVVIHRFFYGAQDYIKLI